MKIIIVAAIAAAAVAGAGRHKIAGVVHKAEHAASAHLASPPPTLPANAPIPPVVIGMNVEGLSYYSAENALYDTIKNHAYIAIHGPKFGKDWADLKDQVPRDAHGGLLHVPIDTELLVQAGNVDQIKGKLLCSVSPGWQISGTLATVAQNGTKLVITPAKEAKPQERWLLMMRALHDDVSLTDLSCRPEGAPPTAKFRPEFLADMKPFGIVRFMNWMLANNNPETSWATRPSPDDLSFVNKGMPVEYMVDLANQLHSDPWFTLPLGADDEYQRNFAIYVRDHLAPGLKAYVELSNEVWNNAFPQSKMATMLGKAKYPSEDDVHANEYYHGDRIRHMMAIWSDVFAGQKQRIVRVAGTQADWPDRGDYLLGHADTAKSVDVLAVAPYFGGMPFDVPGTGQARIDGMFARMPQYIDKQIQSGRKAKAIALKYGLRLVTYEAGTAFDAYEEPMKKDVMTVLHDPRLVPAYTSYLTRWTKEIGGEMVLFDSVSGVWGHLDYSGQPWREMPKMTAAVNVIAATPQGQQRGIKPVTLP